MSSVLCSVYSTEGLVLALIFRCAIIPGSCSFLGHGNGSGILLCLNMMKNKIKILGFEEVEPLVNALKIAPFPKLSRQLH